MSDLFMGVIGMLIGCFILIAFYAAVYFYRDRAFKKEMAKYKDDSDWWVMNAYRGSAKAECERRLKNNDKTS